jgi:hypothetical protein
MHQSQTENQRKTRGFPRFSIPYRYRLSAVYHVLWCAAVASLWKLPIIPVIIGGLVIKIVEETRISNDEAFDKLYSSELYASLENEATKVWTYSVPKLFDLYQSEISTGRLELPEY